MLLERKFQTTSAGSHGLISPSSFHLALPEIRVPLEALLYKVMEVSGEGPKIRVQGWLSIGRSHVANSHALAHPVVST